MELEIQGRIGRVPPPVQDNKKKEKSFVLTVRQQAVSEQKKREKQAQEPQKLLSKDELENILRKIIKDASLLNRDLKYSINNETEEIVVKVIDKTTDKVIKEIPPEAIQRLQARLKYEIGLLIDEQI